MGLLQIKHLLKSKRHMTVKLTVMTVDPIVGRGMLVPLSSLDRPAKQPTAGNKAAAFPCETTNFRKWI